MSIRSRLRASLMVLPLSLIAVSIGNAQYSGGSGTADSPYQIATAADLIALGETPDDFGGHFILTADIDLDPNLPGGKVFDRAVIDSFRGVFDGNGHSISHMTIRGENDLGLFRRLMNGARVSNLGMKAVNVIGTGDYVGGLVGFLRDGSITMSYCTGQIRADEYVGGLVGENADQGDISTSYGIITVHGNRSVGGLVGVNRGSITMCRSAGEVGATNGHVGGLVGVNDGSIAATYSTATVSGAAFVGGLVGVNGEREEAGITTSYSTGAVTGGNPIGGLVGENIRGLVSGFWDVETSGRIDSAGGDDRTTAELQIAQTFLDAGWDFVAEVANGTDDVWIISNDTDYPRLWWERYGGGAGELDNPYLICTAGHLSALGAEPNDYGRHFKLMADVDLSSYSYDRALIAPDVDANEGGFQGVSFTGVFDGSGHTVSHLTIKGADSLGLFGQLGNAASTGYGAVESLEEPAVLNLGLEAVDIDGRGDYVGALVGRNYGRITACYGTGSITGGRATGGLAGQNIGEIAASYGTGTVRGLDAVGGLVGENWQGSIVTSYSGGTVNGQDVIGGLAGSNVGSIATCYSSAEVYGDDDVGGLVGRNTQGSLWSGGTEEHITASYSVGPVTGRRTVGGLVGRNSAMLVNCYSAGTVLGDFSVGGLVGQSFGNVIASFWDREASGVAGSAGGSGKTTAEMQRADTFPLWGTCANAGIWTIDDGRDYPKLWWQESPGEPLVVGADLSEVLTGRGSEESPYLVYTRDDLNLIAMFPCSWDKHFKLMADIDLSGDSYDGALIAANVEGAGSDFQGTPFSGVFDGDGHVISHLVIAGDHFLGLFGQLSSSARILNLGLEAVDIRGTGNSIGALAGALGRWEDRGGAVTNCYSTGAVTGTDDVGGLVGGSYGSVTYCHTTTAAGGRYNVGGLVGGNNYGGSIVACYSTGAVAGARSVGGLAGRNDHGAITSSYSAGKVTGNASVGGLVGFSAAGDAGSSFWDMETSGQSGSDGGTGKTTAEMQTAGTFLEAGWDFVDETDNGAGDIWWIVEGQGYPHLWWESLGGREVESP